jgi:hypothetical protein
LFSTTEGSASVYVHRVETAGAYIGDLPDSSGVFMGRVDLEPTAQELEAPKLLQAGADIQFRNPWSSMHPTMGPGSWAALRVFYSVALEAPTRSVEIACTLPIRADE